MNAGPEQLFFVVSTGRAGTQSLSHCLSQAPETLCLHEPDPHLIRSTTLYTYGLVSRRRMARRIRDSRPVVPGFRCYGETNNRFGMLIEPLCDAFPTARLVWFVRDGRDCVASEFQRGAYRANPLQRGVSTWERWRVRGDRVGDLSGAEWASLSRFEKVCWSWTWKNRRIERQLRDRPHLFVRTHELRDRIQEIASFVGLPEAELVVGRSNARGVGSEGHPNAVKRIQSAADWTPEQHRQFERLCGAAMDDWMPEWREGLRQRRPLPELNETQQAQFQAAVARVQRAEAEVRKRAIAASPARRVIGTARRILLSRQ